MVRKAVASWTRTKRTWTSMKLKVSTISRTSVSFKSARFGSLKVGECSSLFRSSTYFSVKRKYDHAVRMELTWRAKVSEAWKFVIRSKLIAKRMVKKCHCSVKAAYKKTTKIVFSKKRVTYQAKAYAKCKMMACVLRGTKVSNAKCKGVLKTLKKTTLYSATAKAVC